MSAAREERVERERQRVALGMELRRPQREALQAVHEFFKTLKAPLAESAAAELAFKVRDWQPALRFADGYARLTFSLATGVGKTRLMGAIMAYLYGIGESRNFLLLAPRDAILRKLEAEAMESHPKYLFVERSLVPQPRVCHRGNLEEFDPAGSGTLYGTGPNVFLFSPQLLTVGEGRIDRPSAFAGVSIREYLRACPDLVVFFDESHHLGGGGEWRTWAGAVRGLNPKLLFAMTATPGEGDAVVYEYNLRECLREGIYTKAVRLLIERAEGDASTDPAVSPADAATLGAGLNRLRLKEAAVGRVRTRQPAFPAVQPVLLVCAANIEHCKAVHKWLIDKAGLRPDEVLAIHSRQKTETDMRRLGEIERPGSTVRVVVQVHVLDEGWDVSNVYVIAPLRSVQSYRNARQVMGRGLRLPLGRWAGDIEADTLDVLAFGQETIQDIHKQATAEFEGAVSRGGFVVQEAGSEGGESPAEVVPDDAPASERGTVPFLMRLARPLAFDLPLLDLVPGVPSLSFVLAAQSLTEQTFASLELGSGEVSRVAGAVSRSREAFVDRVARRVIEDAAYLSDATHGPILRAEFEARLDELGMKAGEATTHDDAHLARAVSRILDDRYRLCPPAYDPTTDRAAWEACSADAMVRDGLGVLPLPHAGVVAWEPARHARIPFGGWSRCVHEAARFDTGPECRLARLLDRLKGVAAWMRNCPAQLTLPTALKGFSPDFLVRTEEEGIPPLLFVEVKGEHLYEGEGAEARVKCRNVKEGWIPAANASLGHAAFGFVALLGADVEKVSALSDLIRLSRA